VNVKSRPLALCLCLALATANCGGNLDAGRNVTHGPLAVDVRNPVIITNDAATDNWMGVYAFLFANNGGAPVSAIIVCSSNYWTDLNANVTSWTDLVTAARASGLENIPDVTVSAGASLTKSSDGTIESTVPNHSAGAQRIVELSRELGTPQRPLVILSGTRLTEIADAYLLDHTVVDRVVVVASLGTLDPPKVRMTGPNGDLDPWADWIVAQRFKYIQITALYNQTMDVTADQLDDLPQTPFGAWIADKQPTISTNQLAADQVTVLATALPDFATIVQRSSADISAGFGSPQGQGPPLIPDESGNAWVVTKVAAPLGPSRLWHMLLEGRELPP
jgi:hypothetical protein